MASANASWSEDNFSCSICLDVLKSPVSTPCGHNYCKSCITKLWDGKSQYKCPVCNKLLPTIPDLGVNTLMSRIIDRFRRHVQDQPCVEPREVPCDVCTGTQLKAVQSCLMCLNSYCDTHLEPHKTISALKKHQLVDPMDHLEDRRCKKHNQLLELFCKTEQVCVCQICTETDHESHPIVPLKEEFEMKTAQLGDIESEVQQMVQDRQHKIQEIKDTLEFSKIDADREIADGDQVIERCKDHYNQMVKAKLKSVEKQAKGHIKELEQEVQDLTNRISQLKELSHTEDHLHLLQTFRYLKNFPHTRDWTGVEVCPLSYVETLRRSLGQLENTLNMEMKKLLDLKPALKKYACELTLDPNTAHRELSLSEGNRKVTWVRKEQLYPDHPERFDSYIQVLCREGLTRHCYWEVEWKGDVFIGVTYRGITRRGGCADSRLGYNNMSWSLGCYDGGYTACYNSSTTSTRLSPSGSHRVGVYLNRPTGTLAFYRVSPDVGGSSDILTHIHTFSSTFTQDLYPGFGFHNVNHCSSVSLCRL